MQFLRQSLAPSLSLALLSLAPQPAFAQSTGAPFLLASGSMHGSPADVATVDDARLVIFKHDDTELRAYSFDRSGNYVATLVLQDLPAGDLLLRPALGTLAKGSGSLFVIAWEVEEAASTNRRLEYTTVRPGAAFPGPVLGLPDSPADDVHVSLTRGASTVGVAWEETGAGLRGATLALNGGGPPSLSTVHGISYAAEDTKPTIAKRDGGGTLVSWKRDPFGPTNGIWARYWPGSAPTTEDEFPVITGTQELNDPSCDGSGPDDFFIAWSEEEAASSAHDIRGIRMIFPTDATRIASLPVEIETTQNDDEVEPLVRFNGNAYVVGYYDAAGTSWFLDAKCLDPMSGAILYGTNIAVLNRTPGFGILAQDIDSADVDMALFAFAERSGAATTIQGRELESPGGRLVSEDVGCSAGGGELRASTATDGNPAFQMELWGAELNAPFAWVVASASRIDATVGTTTLVPNVDVADVYELGALGIAGYAKETFALPVGLSGGTYWAQCVLLTNAPGCTGFQVALSDALEIRID